eukprot:8314972-Heterocapsa_arctica.AAC.1
MSSAQARRAVILALSFRGSPCGALATMQWRTSIGSKRPRNSAMTSQVVIARRLGGLSGSVAREML